MPDDADTGRARTRRARRQPRRVRGVDTLDHEAAEVSQPNVLKVRSDLDPLDIAVIEILQEDGRASYRQIARLLSTTEKSVRGAVLRLLETSVIEITAVTFPPLLGYRAMASVGIRCSPDRPLREIASALTRIEAVDYVALTSGGFDLFVWLTCMDRAALLEVLDSELRPTAGVASIEVFFHLGLHYRALRGSTGSVPLGRIDGAPDPTDTVDLGETDRQIVSRLGEDGRTPYQAIAADLGISEGQVRQRARRLLDAGALRIVAIVNPANLGYDTMAWVCIRTTGGETMKLVEQLAGKTATTYIATTAGTCDIGLELVCADEWELSNELDCIRSLEGVTDLRSFVYLDLHYMRELL
jgi:DNA-binding Lrp family transcriptional regulator